MKRITLLGLLVVLMTSAGGCLGRAAKEVFLSPKGISAAAGQSGTQQNSYSKVEFQDFSNTSITTMPADMNRILRTVLAEELSDLKPKKAVLDPAASRVLIVRGQYLYYEEARGIFDQAFGPFEEIIALVELVDKTSGRIEARGYCVGRTNTSRLQGPKRKAEGLSKAIIELIDKNCKTPPRPE
ncbi:MAG: hypothetical protein QGH94_00610 [Phycisphaerae bacterium]|jgi:hypothetical protein|nr:hypothetical protein [Phycisphaerae bacterium]